MEPKEHLILALDVPNRAEALRLVELLSAEVGLFKVGWQLFLAEGPKLLLDLVRSLGPERIFLDLKIYDISNTLKGALRQIVPGVALVTIHNNLGPGRLTAILTETGSTFKVMAVTLLTNLSGEDLRNMGYASEYALNPPGWCCSRPGWLRDQGATGLFAPVGRSGP